MEEVADYVRNLVDCDVDVRKEFFSYFLKFDETDRIAQRVASTRVLDIRKPFITYEPSSLEIDFEKTVILTPNKRFLGILYDGFEIQKIYNELVPEEENNLDHVHILLTNRLICTYSENDLRYHYRTIICGYPTIICTSGIVEAPARPKEFYLLMQYYTSLGNTNFDEIKTRFEGRFIDYDDFRFTEVVKGFVLQGLFYYITGNAFCDKKECRLFNAHWQEDMIEAQLNNGNLCNEHLKFLHDFNILES